MSFHRMFWIILVATVILILTISSWKLWRLVMPFDYTATYNYEAQSAMLGPEEIYRYFHWTNSTSCLLSVDFGFYVAMGVHIAAPDGHKAVCLDQFIAPVYNNCLVYSFGINNQWTFDDAMAQFGCQVYSFDPSMGVGDYDRSQQIHFYSLGLSGRDEVHPSTKWKMKTAWSIYQMLAPRHGVSTLIDVLKMDIEFYEWDAIPQMLRSGFLADKVKQLAVEIHFNANDTLETFKRYASILQDVESTGQFVRFSSRPNPGLKAAVSILKDKEEYIGLELAWYNSRFYYSIDNNQSKTRFFPYF
uniref:Methyltransferase domain-containing protein n=1 Tax=Daphnia galeata TaxID=27404 RepID=A0A8J2S1G3_9CRUS|nr:unnamed protein product [Daphnia galeata]